MLLAAPRVVISEQRLARPLVEDMMHALGPLVGCLDEAVERGQLDPGASWDRAVVLFGTIQGLLMLRKQASRAPELFDPERLVIESTCNHLIGWGASDEHIREALMALGEAT